MARSADGGLLAAAASNTPFGCLKLFRYPVGLGDAPLVAEGGHSSPPLDIVFAARDVSLFSAGGNDSCIFQWEVGRL